MSCISYCNTVFQRVDDLPSLVDATRNHAYITPDNKIYILNADGTGYMQMSTSGGGVTVGLSSEDGSITIVETKDSVTHTFDLKVSDDIINRITALENKPDKDTIYDDSVLETKINDILDKVANLGGSNYTAGTGITISDDGVISLVDTTDDNTTYTAGNGLTLNGTTFNLLYSTDFRLSGNTLDMNPAWLANTLKTNNENLIKVTQVAENTYLDLAGIKKYIDDGDTDYFNRVQYVNPVNAYIPNATTETSYTFNMTSNPRSNKLAHGFLVITIPSYVFSGIYTNTNGDIVDKSATTVSTSSSEKLSFITHVYNDNISGRYFTETIRIPNSDIELTLSGYLSMGTASLTLSNVEFYITTGKLINNVEHKFVGFINNRPSYTRSVDGRTYTFTITHVPKIEFWGLNIAK